jgi:hypothetical protein
VHKCPYEATILPQPQLLRVRLQTPRGVRGAPAVWSALKAVGVPFRRIACGLEPERRHLSRAHPTTIPTRGAPATQAFGTSGGLVMPTGGAWRGTPGVLSARGATSSALIPPQSQPACNAQGAPGVQPQAVRSAPKAVEATPEVVSPGGATYPRLSYHNPNPEVRLQRLGRLGCTSGLRSAPKVVGVPAR